MISYAQNNEDVMLERVLAGQHKGFYMDVGAWDAVVDSTTKNFYDKGWSGINIEPSLPLFEALRAARELMKIWHFAAFIGLLLPNVSHASVQLIGAQGEHFNINTQSNTGSAVVVGTSYVGGTGLSVTTVSGAANPSAALGGIDIYGPTAQYTISSYIVFYNFDARGPPPSDPYLADPNTLDTQNPVYRTTDCDQRTYFFGSQTDQGILMYRHVFVPANDTFVRISTYFKNVSNSNIVFNPAFLEWVDVSPREILFDSSSEGVDNANYQVRDPNYAGDANTTWWTARNIGDSNAPRYGLAYWGGQSSQLSPTTDANLYGSVSEVPVTSGYQNVTIAPAQTMAFLHFVTLQPNRALARTKTIALATLSNPNALLCMTTTELGQVVNFDISTAVVTTGTTTGATTGTTTGSATGATPGGSTGTTPATTTGTTPGTSGGSSGCTGMSISHAADWLNYALLAACLMWRRRLRAMTSG